MVAAEPKHNARGCSSPSLEFTWCLTKAAERAADQEQGRRQTCLPEGLSAAAACCEALRAEQQGDGHPQRVVEGAKRPRQQVILQFLDNSTTLKGSQCL
jgi:hypothetical protein